MSANKHFSRRDFLRVAGTVGAGALLASCTTPSENVVTPSPAAAEKVTLRWWSYYDTASRGGLFPTLAKEYQEKHPNVTLEMMHTGAANYNELLTTAFATGDPPELFIIQHYNFLQMAGEESLLDLTDWHAQSGMDKKLAPAALDWVRVKGKLYGTTTDVFTQEWYYNAAIFEKFGLSEPKTGDDFFAVGNALKGKVRFPLLFGGGEGWAWTGILLTMFQTQTMGLTKFLDATAKKDYQVPELLQAVQIVQRLFKEEIIPLDSLAITVDGTFPIFAAGDGAIMPEVTALHSPILKAVEGVPAEKVKLAVFKEAPIFVPNPVSKWSVGYGAVWCVPRNNKRIAETLDFLTFLASPEVQRRMVEGNYFVSPVPETWDAIKDPILAISAKHLQETTSEGFLWEDFMNPRVEEAIDASMRKMVTGEGTPEQVLDAMTNAIRSI